MKKLLTLIAICLPFVSLSAADFTNQVAYTEATTTLNSTSYVNIVTLATTNTVRIIPVSGIKIANTNASSTSTVSVAYSSGNGSYAIDQVSIIGPSGVWFMPVPISLDSTNGIVKAKMGATESAALDITYWYYDATLFTP